jgi:hypothetical protein
VTPRDIEALADFICERIDDEQRARERELVGPLASGADTNAAAIRVKVQSSINATHANRKFNVRYLASLPAPPTRRLLRIAARYWQHPDFRDEWRS